MPIIKDDSKRKLKYKPRKMRLKDDRWCTDNAARYAALRYKRMFAIRKEDFLQISEELSKIEEAYIERFGSVRSKDLLDDLNKALML